MATKNKSERVTNFDELMAKYGAKGEEMLIEGDYVFDNHDRIPSGSLQLDLALGWHPDCPNGGWPVGKIIEIFGPEASGKTTLGVHAIANAQRKYPDKKVGLIDTESSFNLEYAMKYSGLSKHGFYKANPDTAEQSLNLLRDMVSSAGFSAIVLDSVAGLVPLLQLEGEIGQATIGLRARLLSDLLPQIAKYGKDTDTTIFFINQERMNIGAMGYGPKEQTTGGKSIRYYTSVRADVARIGQVLNGETVIGSKTKIKVVKNKTAPPYKEAEFDLVYGEGVDGLGEMLDIGIKSDIIKKKGSGYYVINSKSYQGRQEAKRALHEDKETYDKIYSVFTAPILKEKNNA
jgi:recombination protein RecA